MTLDRATVERLIDAVARRELDAEAWPVLEAVLRAVLALLIVADGKRQTIERLVALAPDPQRQRTKQKPDEDAAPAAEDHPPNDPLRTGDDSLTPERLSTRRRPASRGHGRTPARAHAISETILCGHHG